MICSRTAASRAPPAPLCGRCAPLDPPARSQDLAAIGRREHTDARPQPPPRHFNRSAGTTCGAQPIQVSPCAGMTLYQVLRELQIVLAVILGACPLCCQPVTLDRLAAALAGT